VMRPMCEWSTGLRATVHQNDEEDLEEMAGSGR
jgi:hypothetical protein